MAGVEDIAQAVTHLKLTFPKKIFEVCHLMKRETEAEFLMHDDQGLFKKEIRIARLDDDNVSISLTVDNLTFEANNLCFCVGDIQAKDDSAIRAILANPLSGHEVINKQTISTGNVSILPTSNIVDPASDYRSEPLRKRMKVDSTGAIRFNEDSAYDEMADQMEIEKSSKRMKKTVVFTDSLEHQLNEGLTVDEGHIDENVAPSTIFSTSTDASLLIESLASSMNNAGEQAKDGVADVHVVVETQAKIRPARSVKKGEKVDSKQSDKQSKPHAAKGKKRPHYKREANIECKICRNMYKDELSLIAHVQKLHGDSPTTREYVAELKEQAKVTCKICGKVLGNKRNEINSHMTRVHGEDDNFISRCEECGAEFRRSFLLKEHIRRQHPKHERVLCHLCPASFKLKEYLTEHLKYTHNKEFKWQCDICGKMTSSPKNLRRHKKLHEGLSYECPVCSKLFSESGNMKRHMSYVHNAQAISKCRCPYCNKEFSTKSNLVQHLNAVHSKTTPFYCDICKKYFARKKLLLEHASAMHPGVPILSTAKTGSLTNAEETPTITGSGASVMPEGQHGFAGLVRPEVSEERPTVILEGAGSADHVLMSEQRINVHNIAVPRHQQDLEIRPGEEELSQPTHNVNLIATEVMTDSSLASLAQQALAAFEAGGGLDGAAFEDGQYLNVIGDDGQEIRVQIVRKDPSEVQDEHQLENIYVQAEAATLNLTEAVDQHHIIHTDSVEVGQHELTTSHEGSSVTEADIHASLQVDMAQGHTPSASI
ncbi:zinc finger protein 37-like [Watersipora subatra]|uniref:zinc finger protein 37-like n=1 Tax=Watersipora subatra TaxID=2589382 RepID=UPI00355B2DDA